jgi:hypothetical protein
MFPALFAGINPFSDVGHIPIGTGIYYLGSIGAETIMPRADQIVNSSTVENMADNKRHDQQAVRIGTRSRTYGCYWKYTEIMIEC